MSISGFRTQAGQAYSYKMWIQLIAVCLILVNAEASPGHVAVSHQARSDNLLHGHIASVPGLPGHPAPLLGHYHPNIPSYKFSYSVSDPKTGDEKAQAEWRHGDLVKGAYALVEPDGNVRTVQYAADSHRGFNADVHHKTHHRHI